MYLKKIDYLVSAGVCTAYFVLFVLAWRNWSVASLLLALPVFLGVVLLLELQNYRKIQRSIEENFNTYRGVESLFSIFATLPIKQPLPFMRGMAISPDLGNLLLTQIQQQKPECVLELGAGASTLLTAYCLRMIGQGRVISLEDQPAYAQYWRDTLRRHGVDQWATIIDAPLKDIEVNGERWKWYDTSKVKDLPPVGVLLVDGPPDGTQRFARYPALPLLHTHLSENAVVLVDDAARVDEKQMVQRWLSEYSEFDHMFIKDEKGTSILRRTKSKVQKTSA